MSNTSFTCSLAIIFILLALVTMFSPLDQEVFVLSNNVAYICQHGGIDTLTVMDIKAIIAIVVMIPNYEVTSKRSIIILDNRFALVEASFLQLAILYGTLSEDDDAMGNITDTAI